MRRLIIALLFAFPALLLSNVAQAIVLSPTLCTSPGKYQCWRSGNRNTPTSNIIEQTLGIDFAVDLVYQSNLGGSELGEFAPEYATFYNNNEPDDADIYFFLGDLGAIDCTSCFISVHTNSQSTATYIFDISVWNGEETLSLRNFWPNQGFINSVAIWREVASIPAPNTFVLAGVGLLGLVVVRRRKKKSSFELQR